MRHYIIRRVLLIIPTLFVATLVVFFSVRFIPGSIIELMVTEAAHLSGVELTVDVVRHSLGLDVPIHIQYGHWLMAAIQGDLGHSLWRGVPVTELIFRALPVSLELGLIAVVSALILAFPIAIYSGIRQDTWGDYIGRSIAILCICLPSFWLGTMAVVFPAVWWRWSPSLTYIPLVVNPIENLVQFMLPGFILGMVMSGRTMRMIRTMMLEVLRQDYIRTAWSKGLRERTIVLRHTLKNALIPVVTHVGLDIPILVAGTVYMESIFCLPGMGLLLLDALNARDYPIVSGINVVLASFILGVNLVVDLTYAYLDPRVHYK